MWSRTLSHQRRRKDGKRGLLEPIISGLFFSAEQCIMDHRESLLLTLPSLGVCSFGNDMTVLLLSPRLNKGTRLHWEARDPAFTDKTLIKTEIWVGRLELVTWNALWWLIYTTWPQLSCSNSTPPYVTLMGLCVCLLGRNSVLYQENSSIDTGQVDIGKRAGQSVPPGVFWRSQLSMEQPRFVKFNISVQKNALIGVYGRKGLAPSHTQVKLFDIFLVHYLCCRTITTSYVCKCQISKQ